MTAQIRVAVDADLPAVLELWQLAVAQARLESSGARRLQAIVVESDDRAIGFWRASTWEEQSERRRFVLG